MKDYLLANRVLPVSGPPLTEGFVAFEDGRIASVGRIADLPSSLPPGCRVTDLRSDSAPSLLTPGLVNTHAHLELSFDEPVPMTASMDQWLLDVVALSRKYGSSQEQQARCAAGVEEMLAAGTTCVNDISSRGASLAGLDESGMRAVVALEFFHPASHPVDVTPALQTYQAFFASFAGHPRIRPAISPHSPYNVAPDAWKAVIEACSPFLVHTHAAESRAESDWLAGRQSSLNRLHQQLLGRTFQPTIRGLSPVAYLQAHGLLSERLIVAHAVCLAAADRRVLREHGVGVSHCPRSNLMLHEETLDWADWRDSGIPVGLGTDSRLSNRDLDLRAEARMASSLHGWSAAQALRHCTLEGAAAMKMDERIGSLAVGKAADMALWLTTPGLLAHSPEKAWLDGHTQAVAVWIDGIRVWDRKKSTCFGQ